MVALGACSDPADPPPVAPPAGIPRWSTAPYVHWQGPDSPPTGLWIALFVAPTGGPLDQIAADPDVSSFLNDRFEAWFVLPSKATGWPEGVTFIDRQGCIRAGPATPTTAQAWIGFANGAVRGQSLPAPSAGLPPAHLGFALPDGHPLGLSCPPDPAE